MIGNRKGVDMRPAYPGGLTASDDVTKVDQRGDERVTTSADPYRGTPTMQERAPGPAMGSHHPFAPSGRREAGPAGTRTYEVCATCGKRQIGTTHGRRSEPVRRAGRDIGGPAGLRIAPQVDQDVVLAVEAAEPEPTPSGRAHPVVYHGHPYRLSSRVKPAKGSVDRTIHLCAECGKAANAPAHRATAIPGDPPPKRRKVQVSDRLVAYAEPKPETTTQAANVPASVVETRSSPWTRRPSVAGSETAPIRPANSRPLNGANHGAEPVPPPARPRPVRPEKVGAEVVALAITLDAVLALPPDRVPWKLRLKMVALRDAIPLAQIPSLADPAVVVEDAPSDVLVGSIPGLESRTRVTHTSVGPETIVKGIRSDRHRELVRRAIKAGWTVHKTGGGHIALDHGSSRLIVSTTANNDRMGHGWGNLRAQAKRLGLDVAGL